MGTRHLIAVVVDGEYKVAQYGQWDGYPTGQGEEICNFIRKDMKLKKFKDAVRKCRFIEPDELHNKWIECGADPNDSWVNSDVSDKFKKKYPHLSRDAGSNVLGHIQNDGARELDDVISFAEDSLFCEWAYVLDLDNRNLEVYKGFNQEPIDKSERFYTDEEPDNGYYPVKLVATYKFRNKFVCKINKNAMTKLEESLRDEGEDE